MHKNLFLMFNAILLTSWCEMSLTYTKTPKPLCTQLFTLISAPHTRVTYVSVLISAKLRCQRESKLQDDQGQAVLLSKKSPSNNSGHFYPLHPPQTLSFHSSRPFIHTLDIWLLTIISHCSCHLH